VASADETEAATKAPAAATGVSAGRGLVYVTLAKLWFMVGGYAIAFGLPHLLDQARFGEWAVILSWVSPLNNVMVQATIQGVAKFSAGGADSVEGAKRAALWIQLVVGLPLAILFLAGAPIIAGFEHDPGLAPGLRIASTVIFAYSLYAVFVGAANGAREWNKQAGLDASYTTLRAGFVIAGAVVFHSVVGAVGGMAVAALAILLASVAVVGLRKVEKRSDRGQMAVFMGGLAAYLLIQNLLMFIDGWLLKRMVAEAAERAGALNAATIASEQSAIYSGAVQTFARMPFQLMLAVTFVIFPLVSRSTFAEDREKTKEYVTRAIRYSLLAVAAMATGIAARPEALLALFGAKYLSGATALALLAFGYVAFSLFGIAGSIINAAGRTLPTIAIGAVTTLADAAGNWAALRWATTGGHDPLVAAAAATAIAMGIGLVLTLVYLQRTFGASVPPLSVARAAVATGVGVAAGRFLPVHGKLGLAACVAGGLAFIAVLFASRELSMGEIRALRKRA
jgi:stage V sporulation protein B